MSHPKIPYSNPYKFRLWTANLDHGLLNDRQKRMLYHFAGWGPRGCGDWNYQLAAEFHCSKRTVQYDLRRLEKHCFVELRGALGKYRRITALLWPNKGVWMNESHRQMVRNMGAKFCTHQRRLTKSKINQLRDDLFFGRPISVPKNVSPRDASTLSNPQSPVGSTTGGSVNDKRVAELVRKGMIEKLVKVGHPRARAIRLANVKVQKLLDKKHTDTVTQKQGNCRSSSAGPERE